VFVVGLLTKSWVC